MATTQAVTAHGVTAQSAAPRWFDVRMGWDARRVIGVDVARGLAMIGMFGAHLHVPDAVTVADPSTYLGLVHGRSSILFALLAGVSLAIVTGGTRPVTGAALLDVRLRTLVRAVVLFALGGLLAMLGTPIAIILESYALLFVLMLVALSWSVRRLWCAVAVVAVLGPVLTLTMRTVTMGLGIAPQGVWQLTFGEHYPVATWIVFPLAGLAVGRTGLRSVATGVRLVAGGAVAAVAGYVGGHLASTWRDGSSLTAFEPHFEDDVHGLGTVLGRVPDAVLYGLLTAQPHTGTPFEILGSGGFAIAVLGLCLLATRRAGRYVLAPVAAVGALSLTVYTAHVVAYRVLLDDLYTNMSELGYLWWFTVWALVGATVWRLALGRGPLERGIAALGRLAVRVPD